MIHFRGLGGGALDSTSISFMSCTVLTLRKFLEIEKPVNVEFFNIYLISKIPEVIVNLQFMMEQYLYTYLIYNFEQKKSSPFLQLR